jgi:hypothetical protein
LTCPVRALRGWLEQAAIAEGPLFRGVDQFDAAEDRPLHPDSVAYIVKRSVERIGFEVGEFAGHSLRAGLATSAAAAGKSERAIMQANRAPQREYRATLYPRRQSLPGERGGGVGIMTLGTPATNSFHPSCFQTWIKGINVGFLDTKPAPLRMERIEEEILRLRDNCTRHAQ